ncbi:MAG: trigger factor [Candidatus Cloacimonetes bacterium]|jgi:trigger factor|nr:trigger factor [Candidatus Cloacimonadota bacterium]
MANQTAELQVSMEKSGAWARRLTITVPAARVDREKKAAVQRYARQVRLPGFRKGKVPVQLMEKRWGPAIEQEAIEKLIGDAYREAIEQEGLEPISQGSIDHVHYHAGEDLTFHVDLEVRPEIELERLGGFQIRRDQQPVTEEQIDQVIQRLQDENAVWNPLPEGEIPLVGDMVTVEITPKDDATSVEANQTRSYEIVLGEGQAVPAIEEVIRTLKPGEENTFEVELPEDASQPDSPTKPHTVHIRMLAAKRAERPEVDDAFAASVGDFDSVETLRARIRQDLEAEAAREAERNVRSQLIGQIVEANPFEVPNAMIQRYLEQMLPVRDNADAERVAEMHQQLRPVAEQALRRMLVIDRVATMEALRATPEEVDERVASLAERMGRPAAEVRRQLQQNGRIVEIEEEITENKVFAYLESLSTIED